MKLPKTIASRTKLRTNYTFQRFHLLIAAGALGLIGIMALILSFALTPSNGDFEAETMTVTAGVTPTPTPPTPSPTPTPTPTPPTNPGPTGDLKWMGYNWTKRSGGTGGPGVGGWSASHITGPDANGWLTFNLSGQTGAELDSTRKGWGYGTYTATTNFDPSTMAKNAVWGGLFTYDDGGSPGHNEIDVTETTAAWWSGSTPRVDNTLFTNNHSQDNGTGGISVFPSGASQSTAAKSGDQTYQLIWQPGKLTWKWYSGADTSGTLVQTATYTSTSGDPVPTPATEQVIFNIWAYGSSAGTLNVIVKNFTFTPS